MRHPNHPAAPVQFRPAAKAATSSHGWQSDSPTDLWIHLLVPPTVYPLRLPIFPPNQKPTLTPKLSVIPIMPPLPNDSAQLPRQQLRRTGGSQTSLVTFGYIFWSR